MGFCGNSQPGLAMEDESFLGNLFGWSKLVIESRSASYPLSQVTKESVRYFKERFYEQLRLINQV